LGLSPGTRLGGYEILSLIGSGGMGEVYRARDSRLGRDVAIKVLPSDVAADHDRLARFEREAQVLASLNHTNIANIYGVDDSSGTPALVMELVEGPTLADRIAKGPIPLDEALPIAKQIAEALETAHEQGIIHRDLKPANIKVRADGTVKVLDFGLAKAFDPVSSTAGNATMSPTLSMHATQAGMILGTAAYMSPEQARGLPVDKRSDIWAFGCVLNEMLTGRRLIEGETISDTLASVLTKEPDWTELPIKVQRLLKSCLEKDPKRRLRDIGDAWRLLDDAPGRASRAAALPWAVAALLFMAFLLAVWNPRQRTIGSVERSPTLLDFDLGPDGSFGPTVGPAVVISPDGTHLVFVAEQEDGTSRLLTRRIDRPTSAQMRGTEGAYAPFFSPDGQWVGFFAGGKLKKTRIDGGEPVELCDAPGGRGGTWADDGNIIAALDPQSGLSQIAADGGKPVALTTLNVEAGENTHRWPHVLPGGAGVLFTASAAYGNYDEASIAVVSLRSHQTKTLLAHAGMSPHYLPSGHLVFATKGSLFAAPFDLDRLEIKGTPVRLESISSNPNLGAAQMDFSRNGTLVYRTGGADGLRTLQWLDNEGKTTSLGFEPALYLLPRLSPDGSRLAYVISQGPNTDLWIYDLQRGIKTRLTTGENAQNPIWSRDSQFVIFHSPPRGMFWKRADGAGEAHLLMQSKLGLYYPSSLSPDGAQLVFGEQILAGGGEIWTVPVDITGGQLRAGEPRLFVKTVASFTFATFSSDLRWLAYADAEGGTYQVYVRAFPDNGTRVQISTTSGWLPMWSSNGHELFYRTEDQRIMVANYSVRGAAFVAEKPRVWFGKRLSNVGLSRNLDLTPDGKRFIVVMPVESPEPREYQSHINMELNFFDEVRRQAATSK
jgi:serine/threonine-protein kinase